MIHDLKPYPAYKNSGVPWLGEVPEHWKVCHLGRYLRVKSGDMIASEDEREHGTPIYGGNSIRGYTFKSNTCGPIILLGRVGAKCGCVHLVSGELWASEHALRVLPQAEINLNFLALALEYADLNQFAIRTAQPLINSTIVRSCQATFPSLPEQSAIVRYLDHIDRRIRRYIRTKQKLIKLLEEQKQAIIHQAVTRGLDPNVKLKPSGVEWLVEIPKHYNRTKIGRLCQSIRDGTHNPPPAVEGEHRLLSVRNVIRGRFVTRNDDRTMTPSAFADLQRSYTVQENDVVLALVGATTGKSAVVEKMDKVTVQRSIGILRPDPMVLESHFLNFVISSELVQKQIHRVMDKYAAQPGIYLNDVSKLQIVYPELDEQKRIVDFIQNGTQSIDAAIDRAHREISLLREYRIRLIADVVTGKLDVREAALNLPEETDETEVLDDELIADEENTEEDINCETEE